MHQIFREAASQLAGFLSQFGEAPGDLKFDVWLAESWEGLFEGDPLAGGNSPDLTEPRPFPSCPAQTLSFHPFGFELTEGKSQSKELPPHWDPAPGLSQGVAPVDSSFHSSQQQMETGSCSHRCTWGMSILS